MKHQNRFVILGLVLIVAAMNAFGMERNYSKTFSAAAGGTLKLTTDAGSVTIQPSTGNDVIVEAVIKGTERLVDGFEIKAEVQGSDVVIDGKNTSGSMGYWNDGILKVEFRVKVPSKYNLVVRTSGGSLSFSGIEGTTDGATSGGSITLEGMTGAQDVKTSGGSITAKKINGALAGRTSGGAITVEAVVGDVKVSTSGGSVSVTDVQGEVNASTSGGSVNIGIAKEYKGVYAKTSGGGITLSIPKSAAATIDASTSGGKVSSDLPVTVNGTVENSNIRGTLNGGGKPIYARTSGGSIAIHAGE